MAEISQAEPSGVVRQAHTLLRTEGSCIATLRVPGPAASGDDTEQLGLATPDFQDLSLGSGAFHKASNDNKLIVSAAAVFELVQSLAYDSADVLFETAAGVVINDLLYGIARVVTAKSMGEAYGYWLTLQAPAR